MSRARNVALLSLLLAACGGTEDSSLFKGGKPVDTQGSGGADQTDPGSGGATVSSGGAVEPQGGSAGAGLVGTDVPDASAPMDAAVTGNGGSAGSKGAGGSASEDSGPPPGSGGTPSGAWTRCADDSECVGGRVCTASAQSIIVSGRPGACVRHCLIGPTGCDTPAPGATVSCTQLLIDSFCTFTCSSSVHCPADMDCISGACYYRAD